MADWNPNEDAYYQLNAGMNGINTGTGWNQVGLSSRPDPLVNQSTNQTTSSYSGETYTRSIYQEPELSAEEKSRREEEQAREKARRDKIWKERQAKIRAYEEEREQKRKEAWAEWKKKSFDQKVLHFIGFFDPAQIGLRINHMIENSVEEYEKRKVKEIVSKPHLEYGLEKMQMVFVPINKITEKLLSPKHLLVLSFVISVIAFLIVCHQTENYFFGIAASVMAFYSINISKVFAVWFTVLFFNCVYRMKVLWNDFLNWFNGFLIKLIQAMVTVLILSAIIGGGYICIQLFRSLT